MYIYLVHLNVGKREEAILFRIKLTLENEYVVPISIYRQGLILTLIT